MSARYDVLIWAQRVVARKGSPAHVILELRPDATLEDAQEAFHKIARNAHPDLHRNSVTAEELELITHAYASMAGAYQTFRSQAMQTQRIRPIKEAEVVASALARGNATPARSVAAPSAPPPSDPGPSVPTPGNATSQMSPRALIYYRKAELALRRGDLKGAALQLKMAIATDPGSTFLRTALAEVELELRKGP